MEEYHQAIFDREIITQTYLLSSGTLSVALSTFFGCLSVVCHLLKGATSSATTKDGSIG